MYGIFAYSFTIKTTIHAGKYASPMDPMGSWQTWLISK